MKKLLSIMSSLTITSAAVASVVACGVPTRALDFYVDGLAEYTYKDKDNKDVNEKTYARFSNDGRNGLQSISISILNSLMYSETKYPDEDRREDMEKTLGKEGVNFSLEKKMACEGNNSKECEGINKNPINYNLEIKDKDKFKHSITKSTKDSIFESVNVITGLYSKDSEGKGSIKNTNEVQRYNEEEIPVLIVDEVIDKDKKILSFKKTQNPQYKNNEIKTLENVFGKKDGKSTENGFAMTDKEFEVWWDKNKEWATKTGTEEKTYKSMHQALISSKDKYKKGLYLFGNYKLPNSNNVKLIKPNVNEDGKKEVEKNYDLGSKQEWGFFLNTEETHLQSQMTKSSTETFVYAQGEQKGDQKITFRYFDAEEQDYYDIEISDINDIAIGFGLKGAKIDEISKKDTIDEYYKGEEYKNATKVSTYAFWYEPFGYQFYTENAFAIGDESIYKLWKEKEPRITVKKVNTGD